MLDEENIMRRFFAASDKLLVVYDSEGIIVRANPAWEAVLGYGPEETEGLDSWSLLPPGDRIAQSVVERDLRETGRSQPVWSMRAKDGTYHVVQWSLRFDQEVKHCFGIGRVLSSDTDLRDDLQRRAYTDELTGLANRARYVAEIEKALNAEGTPAALFCDLDHFKVVNDSLGHLAGDQLLAALGQRLLGVAGPDCCVARVGGDEFMVLLPQATMGDAKAKAREILHALAKPFEIAERQVHIGISIGIAVAANEESLAPEDLLGRADMAAYRAKQAGRNTYEVFDSTLRADVDRRFNVEAGLRRALTDKRFEVHYQAMIDLRSGLPTGLEALVRWRDDAGRLRMPGDFLDVASDAGLLPRIGRQVIAEALRAGTELADAGRPLTISINVAAPELAQPDFAADLLNKVREAGIDPGLVLIEITESAVLATASAGPNIARLRAAGIRIALDDFGTGFSALAHLRTLPIDMVKIDRSFVRDLPDDPITRAMTESIVGLGRVLGLDVVLEGVETEAHALAVRQVGGHCAQGFLFHRPMPLAEVREHLALTEQAADVTVQTEALHYDLVPQLLD